MIQIKIVIFNYLFKIIIFIKRLTFKNFLNVSSNDWIIIETNTYTFLFCFSPLATATKSRGVMNIPLCIYTTSGIPY